MLSYLNTGNINSGAMIFLTQVSNYDQHINAFLSYYFNQIILSLNDDVNYIVQLLTKYIVYNNGTINTSYKEQFNQVPKRYLEEFLKEYYFSKLSVITSNGTNGSVIASLNKYLASFSCNPLGYLTFNLDEGQFNNDNVKKLVEKIPEKFIIDYLKSISKFDIVDKIFDRLKNGLRVSSGSYQIILNGGNIDLFVVFVQRYVASLGNLNYIPIELRDAFNFFGISYIDALNHVKNLGFTLSQLSDIYSGKPLTSFITIMNNDILVKFINICNTTIYSSNERQKIIDMLRMYVASDGDISRLYLSTGVSAGVYSSIYWYLRLIERIPYGEVKNFLINQSLYSEDLSLVGQSSDTILSAFLDISSSFILDSSGSIICFNPLLNVSDKRRLMRKIGMLNSYVVSGGNISYIINKEMNDKKFWYAFKGMNVIDVKEYLKKLPVPNYISFNHPHYDYHITAGNGLYFGDLYINSNKVHICDYQLDEAKVILQLLPVKEGGIITWNQSISNVFENLVLSTSSSSTTNTNRLYEGTLSDGYRINIRDHACNTNSGLENIESQYKNLLGSLYKINARYYPTIAIEIVSPHYERLSKFAMWDNVNNLDEGHILER